MRESKRTVSKQYKRNKNVTTDVLLQYMQEKNSINMDEVIIDFGKQIVKKIRETL